MRTIRIGLVTALTFVGCAPSAEPPETTLERSTPEAEGVAPEGIEAFLDGVAESELEVHSFMLLRHGKVVAEGWWEPYGPELRHLLYSASKSITSLGVGMAVDEGKLTLDDRVVSFFPEYVTDSVSPAMREMTVRDLLTMSTGQERDPASTAMRGDEPWVRVFLHAPPVSEPGTVFMYNNLASFMLSAIVQEATGEQLFDYLQPRLFEPLAIENITWDYNAQGITLGMIGARLKTEDLAKLGQLLLQKGQWKGEQLVSAAYVDDAASFHITNNNAGVPEDEVDDGEMGYGYQFWLGHYNSFRMDGLGGQLVIVLPDHDAVVVLTSNVSNSQDEMDLVWAHLVPAFREAPLEDDPAARARLEGKLASLAVPSASDSGDHTFVGTAVAGRRFVLEENPRAIESMTFTVQGDRCVVTLDQPDGSRTLEAGLGSWRYAELESASLAGAATGGFGYQRSSNALGADTLQATVAALSCGMHDEDTFELTARFVEDNLGAETWTADFESREADEVGVTITTGGGGRGGPPPTMNGATAAGPR